MKNHFLFLILFLFITNLQAQQKTLLVYDVATMTYDSITNIEIDPMLTNAETPFFIGNYNADAIALPQEVATECLLPDSEFRRKKKAADTYDISDFPIRTSIRISIIEDGINKSWCSGSMISRRHVYTAAHCIATNNTNEVFADSMEICPVFNNGLMYPDFDCSEVAKIYFFKDWKLGGEDYAILELKEDIGSQTGWLGLGFNEEDAFFEEGIYFKFSYPGTYIPQIDPIEYNGDTLYASYGKMRAYGANSIGFDKAKGIPGESGSSAILVKTKETYTSYGVLSFGNNLIHNRLTNWEYHNFKKVIEDDLTTSVIYPNNTEVISVYPNPAQEYFKIKGLEQLEIEGIILFDAVGREVLKANTNPTQFNISSLENGMYFLQIKTKEYLYNEKVIISKNN